MNQNDSSSDAVSGRRGLPTKRLHALATDKKKPFRPENGAPGDRAKTIGRSNAFISNDFGRRPPSGYKKHRDNTRGSRGLRACRRQKGDRTWVAARLAHNANKKQWFLSRSVISQNSACFVACSNVQLVGSQGLSQTSAGQYSAVLEFWNVFSGAFQNSQNGQNSRERTNSGKETVR